MIFERYILDYVKQFNKLDRDFWNYEDGCVLIGEEALYRATNESFYLESIQNYIARYIGQDGKIKGYRVDEFNIDKIPSGRVLFLLYEKTHEQKYKQAIELLMTQIRQQPRTKSQSFWHKKIYPNQVWLDGLYMGMPFYMKYEKVFNDKRNYPDIIKQFNNVRTYLFDENSGLYFHAYDETKSIFWADKDTGRSANFWTRSIGWFLMALVDCYELLDESDKEYRVFFEKMLKEALDNILHFKDPETGLFYQLTTLKEVEGNYLESSGSFMIAYSLLKGVRLKILDLDKYRGIGEEILIALESRCMELSYGKLSLTHICRGAGLGPEDNHYRDGSIAYYLSEPVVSDEQKGVGVCMLAYSEWLNLKLQKNLDTLGYPKVEIYNNGYEDREIHL